MQDYMLTEWLHMFRLRPAALTAVPPLLNHVLPTLALSAVPSPGRQVSGRVLCRFLGAQGGRGGGSSAGAAPRRGRGQLTAGVWCGPGRGDGFSAAPF